MKKSILVAAIGSALVASTFAADVLVLSGKIETGLSFNKSGATGAKSYLSAVADTIEINVSGTEDLGGGLGGVFFLQTKLEDGLARGSSVLTEDVYAGLQTSAGQFLIGRTETATEYFGAFFDGGTGRTFFNNSIDTTADLAGVSLFWRSPNWSGLNVVANYTGNTDNAYVGIAGTKAASQWGLGLKYAANNFAVGLAYDQRNLVANDQKGKQSWAQIGGSYTFSGVYMGLDYGKVEHTAAVLGAQKSSYDWAGIGFGTSFGASKVVLSYGQRWKYKSGGVEAADKPKATHINLDYAYSLSPRTKIGAGIGVAKDKNGGALVDATNPLFTGVESGWGGVVPGELNAKSTSVGVGISHKF